MQSINISANIKLQNIITSYSKTLNNVRPTQEIYLFIINLVIILIHPVTHRATYNSVQIQSIIFYV